MGIAAMNAGRLSDTKMHMLARNLIVLLSAVFIVACVNDDFGDLQARINAIKAKPAGRIDPIPEFKTYETYTYSASNMRDPFQMFEDEAQVVEAALAKEKSGPKPDENRNKETLEQFPLDTLRYVGQLEKDNEKWAIITSPDALVHRVRIGNYLGQNYGRIVSISEDRIGISELVPDGMGGWIEREAALSLGE